MDADRLAEWGVVAFALSVLAWVIHRLTWAVVRLAQKNADDRDQADGEG